MAPTQVMAAEHRNIEQVVRSLGGVAAALEQGQAANAEKLRVVVEFLRLYADKCHHGKEEELLFPLLVKRGVPAHGCPIGGLQHEHAKGRALVQTLEESVTSYGRKETGARERLIQTLRGIVDLYQNHIWKEDAMVFPMADKVLTAADQRELSEGFAAVNYAIGLDVIVRLEQFAQSIGSETGWQEIVAQSATSGGCGCGCAL